MAGSIHDILTRVHGKDLTKEEIQILADGMTGEGLVANISDARGKIKAVFKEVFEEGIKTMADFRKESEAIRNEIQQVSVAHEKANERLYETLRVRGQLNEAVNLHGESLKQERKRKEAAIGLLDYEIGLLQEKLKNAVIEDGQTAEITARLEDLVLKRAEANQELEKSTEQEEAYNNVQAKTTSIIEASTGVSAKWKKTLWGSMIASKSLGKSLLAVGNAAKKALSPANVLGSTLMKIQEATIAMAVAEEEATVGFAKNTNASKEMIQSTREAGRMHRDLGMGAKEATEHTTKLYTEVRTFSTLTKKQSDVLRTTSMQMANLGVSSSESAQFMAHLMDTMGEGVNGIKTYREELYNLAKSQGISFGAMIKDYNKMRSTLTLYGSRAKEVFKKVQATAKSLRMEVDQLTGTFEDGFNTFEGAFEKTGRLNSILGQYGKTIDPIRMMQGDLADRAKVVADALQGTRLRYEALDGPQAKFYQNMIAGALGTKDTSVVVKLLRGDLSDLSKKTDDAATVWQKFMDGQLKWDAKDNVTFMQQMKMLMMQFGIAILPVLRYLAKFASWLNEAVQGPLGGFFKMMTGTVLVLTILGPAILTFTGFIYMMIAAYTKLAAIRAAKTAQDSAEVALTPAQVAAANMRSLSRIAEAQTAMAASVGLGAWAKAAMAAAVAALAAGAAVWIIANAFKDMDGGKIAIIATAIMAFGWGLKVLIPALAGLQPVIPGLMGFGIALLFIGGAVWLASQGLGYLFETLAKVDPVNLIAAAGALGLIAFALFNLGSWGALFSLTAAIPLGIISSFLNDIKTNKTGVEALSSLAVVLERIENINLTTAANSFKGLNQFMKDVAGISPDVVLKVRTVADAIPQMTGEMSVPASGYSPAETAIKMAEVQIENLTSKIDKLIEGIERLSNRNVILKIDANGEKTLATVIKRVQDNPASRGSGRRLTPVRN